MTDEIAEGISEDVPEAQVFESVPQSQETEQVSESQELDHAPEASEASDTSEQALESQESTAPKSIWTIGFISIFITSLAMNMGMYMSNSILAVYANFLGATPTVVGFTMSTFAVSAIVFRFFSAPIMDTFNRKYVVMLATLVLAVAFFGFSISTSIPAVLGFRLVQGAGMAFGNACCLAIVAGMLPKEKYSSGIAYFSLGTVISGAIGPFVGLMLKDLVGFQMTYLINAGVLLVAVFFASRIKIDFKRTKKLKLSFSNFIAKEALVPTSVGLILSLGLSTVNSFLILFATSIQVENIGLFFTVSAITMLVTRPLVGKLIDRFGLVKVSVPALLCNFVAFLMISASTSIWLFLLAAFISAFGSGACQPAVQALAMKSVTNERRGAASSTNFIGLDLGSLFGPTIAGSIVQSSGEVQINADESVPNYVPMWRIMSFIYIIGMLILIFFRRRIAKIEKDFDARKE